MATVTVRHCLVKIENQISRYFGSHSESFSSMATNHKVKLHWVVAVRCDGKQDCWLNPWHALQGRDNHNKVLIKSTVAQFSL